ncbi:type I restriction endonuclease [Acidisphaera rubrifaciens]|uniref:type I restriction endonuclease n=1 Tax=Acidisphaera rubrifaciens TaxID=50715 RepID=UPI0009FC4F57|nr:type I restriction endonuclease [Acidisphaera rubrifaciens]
MPIDLEEFRLRMLAHAKLVGLRAPKVDSEAKTNASLVQPFLMALGYDVGNPDEVSPEHHADFSEKYQNKVDFAILHNGNPVIAIESKRTGAPIKDDRGQLRSYFNACSTVKLGILTDGVKYEFYADSDSQNMMDETAFLRVDFLEVYKTNSIDDNVLSGIAAIMNGSFNPQDVGAEAKKKILFESIVETVKKFKTEPSDDFIRFILGCSPVGGKITKVTQKIVDANRELVRSAMETFVAQEALARFGYAPKDVVKAQPERQEVTQVSPAVASADAEPDAMEPSEGEKEALSYVTNRLFFLARNEALFSEIQRIAFRKTKTSFRLYYGRPNSGSLIDYKEHKDKKAFLFPGLDGKELPFIPSPELDACLLKIFVQRVRDAGVKLDEAPVLHAIPGGQSVGAA